MPRYGPEYQALRDKEIMDMRARILQTARTLARGSGWGSVSTRAIAQQMRCSAALIYTYFQDKSELLRDLQKQGLRELGARMQGQNRAEEMSLALFDFALAQPELFALLTGQVEGCPPPAFDELNETCRPALEFFGLHPRPGLSPEESYIRWWSLSYGFILSSIAGMTGGITESRGTLERLVHG
jgi:AcrR family transcriptional regulator